MFLQWSIAAYFTAACSSFFVLLPSFSTVLKIMSVITFGAFTILERFLHFHAHFLPLLRVKRADKETEESEYSPRREAL